MVVRYGVSFGSVSVIVDCIDSVGCWCFLTISSLSTATGAELSKDGLVSSIS